MVAITTTILTNKNVDMTDPGTVEFIGGLSATSTAFSWTSGRSDISVTNSVTIQGTGLTYSGTGDARELSGGTISRISIDIRGDNGSASNGDIVITGTEGLDAANIKKTSTEAFWDEILKGDDTFNLTGLGEADIGARPSTFYGDDYTAPLFSFNMPPGADTGGNDLMIGADNDMTLIGDCYLVQGASIGSIHVPSTYHGGNDKLFSAITTHTVGLFGDVFAVLSDGGVYGGDDEIYAANAAGFKSIAAGDVFQAVGSSFVMGGNDTMDLRGSGSGDVHVMQGNGGHITGGDDVITGSIGLSCAGDIFSISATVANGVVIGGNDRITGSFQNDFIAGDVLGRHSLSNTITGGDDVLVGHDGNDRLWGEVSGNALDGVSGGNDTLIGGGGDDQLFGQTGNDALVGGDGDDTLQGGTGADTLRGGAGADKLNGNEDNDRLTGDDGADLFTFGLNCGVDRITDFVDTGGIEDDRINLKAFDFADRSDITLSSSGNDLVILLGGGDRVIVMDYLAAHTATDILDDILI